MRRGAYENQWDKGPENWVNHNTRFSRGNRRTNYHGFNSRPPAPRHWRPEGSYRPRVPIWNSPFPAPQHFAPRNGGPDSRVTAGHLAPPHAPPGPLTRFSWTPPYSAGLLPAPQDSEHQQEKEKPKQNQTFGLPCDNLHETINTVKQKLRERKVSETNADFINEPVLDCPDESATVKASEKRRIEHTKVPIKPISVKKMDRRETNIIKAVKPTNCQQSPTNSYQKKSEIMRRKILKQLFKMDKDTLREMLSQPKSSTKYDFALNSLIKETRNSISHELRSIAEKSLRHHATNADSLQGKQIVQDAFMGHLGTMLDTDASVELSNMEPQVIAELSKVLQEDLMGTLNEEMSVRSLANAMQDSSTEDAYSDTAEFPHYFDDISDPTFGQGSNPYIYKESPDEHFYSFPTTQTAEIENDKSCEKYENNIPSENDTYCSDYYTNWKHDNSNIKEDTYIPERFNSDNSQEVNTYRNAEMKERYSSPKNKNVNNYSNKYSRRKHPADNVSQSAPDEGNVDDHLEQRQSDTGHKSSHPSCERLETNVSEDNHTPNVWIHEFENKNVTFEESGKLKCYPINGNLLDRANTDFNVVNGSLNVTSNIVESTSNENSTNAVKGEDVSGLILPLKSESKISLTENSACSELKDKDNNLRKRKISESSLNESPAKKSDISEYNICVRKDMFPGEQIPNQKSEETNTVSNCDVAVNSVETVSSCTFPTILVSVTSQTECNQVATKSQGSQHRLKNCDASSQVYESLIFSKSKGTQCVKPNLRDRSCQTLKIEGFPSVVVHSHELNKIDNSCHKETQTKEVTIIKKEAIIEFGDKEGLNILKLTKPIDKKKGDHPCKPEEVLERMRQIDNDIQHLMQEKLKLYNMLEVPSASSETNHSTESTQKSEITRSGLSTMQIPKNKYLDKLNFQKNKSESQKKNQHHSKTIDKSKISKQHTSKGRLPAVDGHSNHHKKSSSQSDHHKTKESNNKHKSNSIEQKNKNVSSSVPKSKSKPIPLKCDRTKHSVKKHSNDSCETAFSNCSASNIVPGKDINNGKSDLVKGSVDVCNNDRPEECNTYETLDVNSETKYVDLTGCPVTLDCNLVVSEEVVIKSDIDNTSNHKNSVELRSSVNKQRKKSELNKKDKTLKSSNNSSKLEKNDCDKIILKSSNTTIPLTIPPIKIRKKRSSSSGSQSRNKSSPLFNLISQLNDTDDECDFEISNPQKGGKVSQPSNDNAEGDHDTKKALEITQSVEDPSGENIKYDLVDCRVYLERLDANKIAPTVKDEKTNTNLGGTEGNTTSFEEKYDTTMMHDETLFATKEYGNDDDCISLEQLDAVQFDDFCDPDVPGIIGNMEVNDSFNIIDQWDSKLFENVSFLEDREIFSDKNLLEGIASNEEATVSVPVKNNFDQKSQEVENYDTINFTCHKDSITALKCVGDNFLAASLDGNVYYYCGLRGKLLQTMVVSQTAVTCLTIKPNKTPSHVYTGSLDSVLRCFDFETGEKTLEDVDVGSPIQSMFQEWKTLYIGTQTGFVVQFDIETSTLVADSSLKFSDTSILALHAIKEGPRKVLLVASRSQEVTVKDASTGLLLRSFHGPNNTVYSLLFDSGKVYCGTSGTDIQVFDFVTGELVGFHKGGRGAVCLQMYRGLLFTGCYDGMIYVFNKNDCTAPVARIPGPGKMLLAMVIVKNKIIAGCKDRSLSVWPLPKEVTDLFYS